MPDKTPATPMPEKRPCRRCGLPIELRLGPNGRVIPLSRVRTVYLLAGEELVKLGDERAAPPVTYVSHFETCPYAREFSRRG